MSNRFSVIQPVDFEDDIFTVSAETAPVATSPEDEAEEKPAPVPAEPRQVEPSGSKRKVVEAKTRLHRKMLDEFNLAALEQLPRDQLIGEIRTFVSDYVSSERLALNNAELEDFVGTIVDELTGLGPLEPLMRNPDISDILINGPSFRFRTRRISCALLTRSWLPWAAASMNPIPCVTHAWPMDRASTLPFAPSPSTDRWFRSENSPRTSYRWRSWWSSTRSPLKWQRYWNMLSTRA